MFDEKENIENFKLSSAFIQVHQLTISANMLEFFKITTKRFWKNTGKNSIPLINCIECTERVRFDIHSHESEVTNTMRYLYKIYQCSSNAAIESDATRFIVWWNTRIKKCQDFAIQLQGLHDTNESYWPFL